MTVNVEAGRQRYKQYIADLMMEKPDATTATTNYSVELLGGAVRRIGELEAEVWCLQAIVGDLIDAVKP